MLTLAQKHINSDGQHTFARNVYTSRQEIFNLGCTKCTMSKTIILLEIIQYAKLN